jgi:hypothetical protein
MDRLVKNIHDGCCFPGPDWNPINTFHGDHSAAMPCGAPTSTRDLTTANYLVASLFWYCAPAGAASGHFMTGMATGSYVSMAFSPNNGGTAPRLFSSVRRVCWDINITDLGHRKWTELYVLPASMVTALGNNLGRLVNPDNVANGGPDGVLPTGGTFIFVNNQGGTRYFVNTDTTFTNFTKLYPPSNDKATRYQTCIVDNRNGTVSRIQQTPTGPVTTTGAGAFPAGPVAVVWKDVSYNPDKSCDIEGDCPGVPDPYTWHWDNLQIS